MSIDLINPDLSWLSEVHNPDTTLGNRSFPAPFELPAGSSAQTIDGKLKCSLSTPYTFACGGTGLARYTSGVGVDIAVRGSLAGTSGIIEAQPPEIVAWGIETFFVKPSLIPGDPMTLDALARHKDLPPPVLTRCPRCRGKMRDPDAEVLVGQHATMAPVCTVCGTAQELSEDQDPPTVCTSCGGPVEAGRGCVSVRNCGLCDGKGRIADFSDSLETIQGVTVDWRALSLIVPHLRGDRVMVGRAISPHGYGFALYLWPSDGAPGHDRSREREWAMTWAAVPPAADVPAVPSVSAA